MIVKALIDALWYVIASPCILYFFFFNDTATTEIYTYCHTLSRHDALPIWMTPTARGSAPPRSSRRGRRPGSGGSRPLGGNRPGRGGRNPVGSDRKSTRLNSSH